MRARAWAWLMVVALYPHQTCHGSDGRNVIVVGDGMGLAPDRIEGSYPWIAPPLINRIMVRDGWWAYPGVGQLVRRTAQRAAKQSNARIVPMDMTAPAEAWDQDPNHHQWMVVVDGKAPDAMINRHAVIWPVSAMSSDTEWVERPVMINEELSEERNRVPLR